MARTRNSTTKSRQNNRGRKKSSSLKWILLISLFVVLSLVIWGVVTMLNNNDYTFKRSDLDKYIEITNQKNFLDDNFALYFDMSDGVDYAYKQKEYKQILEDVIDKLSEDKNNFYALANGKIDTLNLKGSKLFNYLTDSRNYNNVAAPIGNTLQEIVKNKRPALLATDFEEYKDEKIQKNAYAKEYFIKWLKMGYNIVFYKWQYKEKSNDKYMFLAVFDDNAGTLNSKIKQVIGGELESFTLGSRDYAYPTQNKYISFKQGGNYHNHQGKDIVTAVLEGGGADDYICYSKPKATAEGKGLFTPLDNLVGTYAEYYPIGVSWQNAIENSKRMQEQGVRKDDRFKNFLSELYINFEDQDGYKIENIEIRVFDMQETMKAIDAKKFNEIEKINKPEINEMFVVGMENSEELEGYNHVFVNFHKRFDGTFIEDKNSSNLLRANIVISKATPNTDKAKEFFNLQTDPSLFNSIKNTLEESSSNPEGRIVYTYYLKTLAN